MTPEQLLREGLAVYGLPADAAAIEGLEEFSRRLLERNQVMNLTAITDPCDVAALHLLDCAYLLTAADFRGKSVVDVGTGAGFPGMPLRILEPNFDLTLLDSLGKRVDFLRETADAMGLRRVRCVHARAEEFARKHREQFDIATSRAVAQLNVLCELTLPLVKVGGLFAAMKSTSTDEEIATAVRNGVIKMNVDTDTQYAYTRPVAGWMYTNYEGVLKIDGEVGNKKQYDPRAWGKAAEEGMAARVVEACERLGSVGSARK